jgi:hypothetical protein
LHTHTFKAGYIGRIKTKEINKAAGKQVKFVHTFHGHLFDDPEFSGLKSLIITSFERRFAKTPMQLSQSVHKLEKSCSNEKLGNQNNLQIFHQVLSR